MTEREMEGDTCNACEHRVLSKKSCPHCKRMYDWLPAMPYCKKNKIWLVETEMAPCQYFKRGKIWDLGSFHLEFGEQEE